MDVKDFVAIHKFYKLFVGKYFTNKKKKKKRFEFNNLNICIICRTYLLKLRPFYLLQFVFVHIYTYDKYKVRYLSYLFKLFNN